MQEKISIFIKNSIFEPIPMLAPPLSGSSGTNGGRTWILISVFLISPLRRFVAVHVIVKLAASVKSPSLLKVVPP